MSNTEKNLGDAFAGESQANRKYLSFAKQAEQEGYKQVAKLFRAAAEAETVHGHAHLRTLGGIAKTLDNLKTAGVQQAHKDDRIVFTAFTPWPGELVCAEGRYLEGETTTSTAIGAALMGRTRSVRRPSRACGSR